MYDIANLVYGFPYTEEIELEAARRGEITIDEFDPTSLEEIGFEFEYSGSADLSPGWWGQLLADVPSWELTPEWAQQQPSDADKARIDAAYQELPDWVRALAPEPKVIIVWSTS